MKEMDAITFLAHCLKLGVIEGIQVVPWVDTQIAALEAPPYWMMMISSKELVDRLDIQKLFFDNGADREVDDDAFLTLVAGFYSRYSDANRTVALLMDRFCFCKWKDMTVLRQEIYLIDDELGWDESKGTSRLARLLRKYMPAFTAHAERIGLGTQQSTPRDVATRAAHEC